MNISFIPEIGVYGKCPASNGISTQIYIALGSNIQRLRKEVGMTQAQMAEKISRSEDAVSNIERGTSAPPPETALAISKTLGVKLSDLYDFKCEDNPTPDDVRD